MCVVTFVDWSRNQPYIGEVGTPYPGTTIYKSSSILEWWAVSPRQSLKRGRQKSIPRKDSEKMIYFWDSSSSNLTVGKAERPQALWRGCAQGLGVRGIEVSYLVVEGLGFGVQGGQG